MKKTNWLNTSTYPFKSQYINVSAGKLHYIDEGTGPIILMVHGTPVWSYVYRDLVKELSKTHRCIALDHIGFGLSNKPQNWAYTPEAHAENLHKLVDHLQLKDITLMVHDFGGSIGLSYAIAQPQNIKNIILFNTWMWSLESDQEIARASKLLNTSFMSYLFRRFNLSPRFLIKAAYYDKSKLTKEIHQHYLAPFAKLEDRSGTMQFSKELIGSSKWFDDLWQQREKIAHLPFLVLWGMKDTLLKTHLLDRWKTVLTNAEYVELDAGHFVQEEATEEILAAIKEYL